MNSDHSTTIADYESTTLCAHDSVSVEFDKEAAGKLSVIEIRERWPRFVGRCPDCKCQLIKYASSEHYLYGDW